MAQKNTQLEYVRIPCVTGSPRLVLASNSPRRHDLLRLGGWQFHVRPADVDENPQIGETPRSHVLRLAESKARACARTSNPGEVIIAADTTVTVDGEILGKPRDADEAVSMLRHLRGRSHQVCTALAVLEAGRQELIPDLCVTEVPMRAYTDEEMQAYALSGDPLDKAGAYAIQHAGFQPVENLSGCYASVMGLPLCHLTRSLRKVNISPRTNLPAECQSALQYKCRIFSRVLDGEDIG